MTPPITRASGRRMYVMGGTPPPPLVPADVKAVVTVGLPEDVAEVVATALVVVVEPTVYDVVEELVDEVVGEVVVVLWIVVEVVGGTG